MTTMDENFTYAPSPANLKAAELVDLIEDKDHESWEFRAMYDFAKIKISENELEKISRDKQKSEEKEKLKRKINLLIQMQKDRECIPIYKTTLSKITVLYDELIKVMVDSSSTNSIPDGMFTLHYYASNGFLPQILQGRDFRKRISPV